MKTFKTAKYKKQAGMGEIDRTMEANADKVRNLKMNIAIANNEIRGIVGLVDNLRASSKEQKTIALAFTISDRLNTLLRTLK